jgi:hypothetical protein
MYSPYEAREDTVLFPAFHGIVSAHEFDSLGEDFEKKEDEFFGDDGFFTAKAATTPTPKPKAKAIKLNSSKSNIY